MASGLLLNHGVNGKHCRGCQSFLFFSQEGAGTLGDKIFLDNGPQFFFRSGADFGKKGQLIV